MRIKTSSIPKFFIVFSNFFMINNEYFRVNIGEF